MSSVLDIQGVSKRFGTVVAVDDLSLRLEPGEYVCLLGPSGCGKSTLLRLIAGFEEPDSGSIRLLGREMAGVPPERRDVNVVFQSYALFPHLTVADNIAFGLRMKKLARGEIRERVSEAVEMMGLSREADRYPRELSGGQQQRVALARALVNRPALLLLDEPLSALDASLRQRMQGELIRVQRETGVAFLHVTHDQVEALSLADRVAVMRGGRFEQLGEPRSIYRNPASPFVASFVGAANILEGRVIGSERVRLACGAEVGPVGGVARYLRDAPVVLAVRPESIRMVMGNGSSGLRGEVLRSAFRGADFEVVVRLTGTEDGDGTTLRVRAPATGAVATLAAGDEIRLSIASEDWSVLAPTAEPEA